MKSKRRQQKARDRQEATERSKRFFNGSPLSYLQPERQQCERVSGSPGKRDTIRIRRGYPSRGELPRCTQGRTATSNDAARIEGLRRTLLCVVRLAACVGLATAAVGFPHRRKPRSTPHWKSFVAALPYLSFFLVSRPAIHFVCCCRETILFFPSQFLERVPPQGSSVLFCL